MGKNILLSFFYVLFFFNQPIIIDAATSEDGVEKNEIVSTTNGWEEIKLDNNESAITEKSDDFIEEATSQKKALNINSEEQEIDNNSSIEQRKIANDEENLIIQEETAMEQGSDGEFLKEPVSSYLALIDASIFKNTSLEASVTQSSEGEIITLVYTGSSILNINLLEETYVSFSLPPEISKMINEGKGEMYLGYNVPGLLNFSIWNTDPDNIIKEKLKSPEINSQNQVSIETTEYLSVGLISALKKLPILGNILESLLGDLLSDSFEYTLKIILPEGLPLSTEPTYTFYAEAVNDSSLILIDLLGEGANIKAATIEAPQLLVPEVPELDFPYYTTDTVVSGTGEPNAQVVVTIGEVVMEKVEIDKNGNFSVPVDAYPAGTTITAVVDNGHPQQSEEASLTVLEFPKAPTIDAVYSNDTGVTGIGTPDTKVQITIGGVPFNEGTTDSEGRYSIAMTNQVAGTVILASTIDEFGTSSESTEKIVQEASLGFESVPNQLVFKETRLNAGTKTILRLEADWTITVQDTRGPNSKWKLKATAEDLKTVSGHALPDALIYKDSSGESRSLKETQVVYSGQTNEERIIPVSWPAEEGPLLELIPATAYAQQYSTTITWTLEDAP